MLLSSDGNVKDLNIRLLCDFLEVIDYKIKEIEKCISKSVDPESDGFYDQGEYFIGLGFVAIQQHFTDSLIGSSICKRESLFLGELHTSGIHAISVMNAAANWWKHEAEWSKCGEIPKNGVRTFEIIMNISEQYEYALSNVLASFSESESLSFGENVVPHIKKWTEAICEKNET